MTLPSLEDRRFVVGVDGGPTAFEAPEVVRTLVRAGAEVRVAVTGDAEGWIGALALETVSGAEVALRPDEAAGWEAWADALVVAPAGADLVARLAAGRADDAVADLFLRFAGWGVVVPGTDSPADAWVKANLAALGERALVLPPGPPPPAPPPGSAGSSGPGPRGPPGPGDRRVHLEPRDLVRFLSNPSSGRMGFALAEAARRRGAEVVLFTGPTHLALPTGVRVAPFDTAESLQAAVTSVAAEAAVDLVIACAAVADWRPAEVASEKMKKAGVTELTLRLVRTPDVLAELSRSVAGRADRPVLVGFAAETGDLEAGARAKLTAKGLDLVVANRVKGDGSAFGAEDNEVHLVSAAGIEHLPRASKAEIAQGILDWVVPRVEARRGAVQPAEPA